MLGLTASPVALFALGGFIYGRFLKKDLELVFLISLLKTAILPLFIVAGSLILFKADSLKIIVLLSSMPVAATTFVIAEKFNLNKELVGNSILISTIVSFVVAPIIFYFIK
jgi:predicted permease